MALHIDHFPGFTNWDISYITLETPRLKLVEITDEMMQKVMTTLQQEEIKRFLGLATDTELDKEKSNFEKGYSWYRSGARNFVILDANSRMTLGRVGFHTWYQAHSRAEVGYHITRDEDKQKGIMSEALHRMLQHGFDEMKLNRVEAFVGPGNAASQRLLLKMGFKEEGRLREHYYKNGVAEDSLCFGLLRSEWQG
ncbi:MAG: GNAT family N-acetyltransferase [Taibaiella sp.]|nr:GNAT family N-acetyltransferase [Taibaiella sp.]